MSVAIPEAPRIPLPVGEIQVNFCKNPACANFRLAFPSRRAIMGHLVAVVACRSWPFAACGAATPLAFVYIFMNGPVMRNGLAAVALVFALSPWSAAALAAETTPAGQVPRAADAKAAAAAAAAAQAELVGMDSDGNGVRDDLDAQIEARADSSEQKSALRQLAAALGQTLTVNLSEPAQIETAAQGTLRAYVCVFSCFQAVPARAAVAEVRRHVFDTAPRALADAAYQRARGPTLASIPYGDACIGAQPPGTASASSPADPKAESSTPARP
jgi:hypothetical protein